MSAAASRSADADGSVLLASKKDEIAVALHDGDGDPALYNDVLQVQSLLLLVVSSGSLSWRYPPSTFVAA
jgi:hypothetical protein